ncbi:MAG: glycosyltransferase family 4 protein [Planctomycetes bacterium]|nr:glycosyltransferase family 4 protein [Planctomycetota bacterium]
MRILLTSPVLPPELGGPAIHSASLAAWLARRGHEVRLVAFGPRDALALEQGVEVRLVRRSFLPHRYARLASRLDRELRWAEVAFSSDHLAAPLARALRRTGKPGVLRVMIDAAWELASRFGWSALGPDAFRRGKQGLRGALVARAQRRWWRAFRCLVAPSDYLRAVIEEYGVEPRRIVRIDNPFHGDVAALAAVPALARESATLLAVARLVEWKRIAELLDELVRLPEPWRLVIVGDGPLRAALEERSTALGLAFRVEFLGALPSERVHAEMRRATALVLTSRYEGLSHTLLEAMALGLPVIATAVGGNGELLGASAAASACAEEAPRGLALAAEPPWRLAELLPTWLASGAAGACAARARRWIEERHDRERVFAAVESLLAELADEGRARQIEGAAI